MTAAEAQAEDQFRGIAFLLLAVSLFSGLDASAKYLVGHYETVQLVWIRYAVHFALAMIIIRPKPLWRPLISARPALQIVRALTLVVATGLGFTALRKLQMAEMVSILFSAPLLTALLAVPVLGESLGLRRLVAICFGFLGVLTVMRPGFGGLSLEMFLGLGSAVLYSVYSLMTRVVAQGAPPEAAVVYPAFIGTLALLPAVPAVWVPPASVLDGAVMIAAGCFGGLGHIFLVFAYRNARAVVLQPFIYFQLMATVVLGYVVFGDIPGFATALGAGLIVASGSYVAYRERSLRRRAARPVPPKMEMR